MAEAAEDNRSGDLAEAVRRLAAGAERIAQSLANIEALYAEAARKQDEDRAEARERQRRFDAEQEEFKERQRRWDERDKQWDESGLLKAPRAWPDQLANLLLMLALAALAITVAVQARQ